MVRKVIGSLVVLGLIVCGVGVLQTIGGKTGGDKSTEQVVKKEEKIHVNPNKSVQSVSNKVKSQTPKVVKIMNTKDRKMIEEVPLDEWQTKGTSLGYPAWSPDNKMIAYVWHMGEMAGAAGEVEGEIRTFEPATNKYMYLMNEFKADVPPAFLG